MYMLTKMDWAALWAIFSQTHLVTLIPKEMMSTAHVVADFLKLKTSTGGMRATYLYTYYRGQA
jgi:hypothetical protein